MLLLWNGQVNLHFLFYLLVTLLVTNPPIPPLQSKSCQCSSTRVMANVVVFALHCQSMLRTSTAPNNNIRKWKLRRPQESLIWCSINRQLLSVLTEIVEKRKALHFVYYSCSMQLLDFDMGVKSIDTFKGIQA